MSLAPSWGTSELLLSLSLFPSFDMEAIDMEAIRRRIMPGLQMQPGDIDPSLRAASPTIILRPFEQTITEMVSQYARIHGVLDVMEPSMRGYLVSSANSWFRRFMDQYFPERTGALIASYWQSWVQGIIDDRFIISSDLEYARFVNEMFGVNWTKSTTIERAATMAMIEFESIIDILMLTAATEAMR